MEKDKWLCEIYVGIGVARKTSKSNTQKRAKRVVGFYHMISYEVEHSQLLLRLLDLFL